MPDRGRGTVSFYYQYYDIKGGLFSTDVTGRIFPGGYVGSGNKLYHGEITEQTGFLEVDYGVLNRLAISADIAFIGAKYEGRAAHPALPGHEAVDDGNYHPQLQDASMGVRYYAVSRPLAVIPFVRLTLPTHDYVNVGHASVGRGLKQLQIGANLARGLDPFLSKAYAKATLAYSFVGQPEAVEGAPAPQEYDLNKRFVSMELGYLVTPRLAVNAFGNNIHTEGGIDWAESLKTPADYARVGHIHDAAARDRHTVVGGGLGFAVLPTFSVYTSFSAIVSGQNVHYGNALLVGTNWSFGTLGRSALTP